MASILWENDIQIELRYIAAVLAISDNDRDKIDAIISCLSLLNFTIMKFTEENANAILAEINKKCSPYECAISDNDRDKIDAIISF